MTAAGAAGAAGDRTEFRRRRAGDSTRANIGGKLTTGDEGVHLRVARVASCAGLRGCWLLLGRPTDRRLLVTVLLIAHTADCALARLLLVWYVHARAI